MGGGCGELLPRLGFENVGVVCALLALDIVRRIALFDAGMANYNHCSDKLSIILMIALNYSTMV